MIFQNLNLNLFRINHIFLNKSMNGYVGKTCGACKK